jgi:hypothetical protein
MKVIRLRKNDVYDDWDVVNILDADFCQKQGWTPENFYRPQLENDVEMNIAADDVASVETGDIYDGKTFHRGAPLHRVKRDKLAEISAAYNEFDAKGTVTTSAGYPIQAGQAHVSKLDGAIRFAEMTGVQTIYITDANDVTHNNVSIADAKNILMEQMGAAMGAHAKKQALRAQVEAAESVGAVQTVTWEI